MPEEESTAKAHLDALLLLLAGVMDRVRAVGTETEFKLHLFS